MIFANVTDITIPEGNGVKIHETNSGRVLWQKKRKSETYNCTIRVTNAYGFDEYSLYIVVE